MPLKTLQVEVNQAASFRTECHAGNCHKWRSYFWESGETMILAGAMLKILSVQK